MNLQDMKARTKSTSNLTTVNEGLTTSTEQQRGYGCVNDDGGGDPKDPGDYHPHKLRPN